MSAGVSGKPSATSAVLTRPIGDGIRAGGGGVERGLERSPRGFERGAVGVGGHTQRLGRDPAAAAERKIDGRAVPVVELQASPGRDRDRIDRPTGRARELDNAETGDTRELGNVGGERDVVTLLERAQHLLEGAHAALADEPTAVVAGAANGADAEPLRGERIDLAVAMA